MTKPRTITAKILVCVDEHGDWAASAWKGAPKDEMFGIVQQELEGVQRSFRWVKVELPVPEAEIAELQASPA